LLAAPAALGIKTAAQLGSYLFKAGGNAIATSTLMGLYAFGVTEGYFGP
jgi:hypothetical protein